MPTLFDSTKGKISDEQIRKSLFSIGACDCDILYIHTGMTFGLPAAKRNELLSELLYIFETIGVDTLIFPTFTFSFCNAETYDMQKSVTPMGALNEFARKSGKGIRSSDPLLSIYVIGKDKYLAEDMSEFSIGKGSSYDKLHNCGKTVKFLFFGADMRECFTYTHYVEAINEVPYRYNREFGGIIRGNGQPYKARAYLYSTYANCRLTDKPIVHDYMHKNGMLHKIPVGDTTLCCFDENDGYNALTHLLEQNIYVLTDGTFDPKIKDKTYNIFNDRILSVR